MRADEMQPEAPQSFGLRAGQSDSKSQQKALHRGNI